MHSSNILVVAKDRMIIDKIKACFDSLGHQVIPAYDVSLGFFLAQKNYPDLILCQPELKEGSAEELQIELLNDPELASIPFFKIGKTDSDQANEDDESIPFIDVDKSEGYLISELLPVMTERAAQKNKRPDYSPE